jgi:O-antigen/teichoic acid export membrane protein
VFRDLNLRVEKGPEKRRLYSMDAKKYRQQIIQLFTGAGFSHLIPVLAIPVLTKIFTPAEFGVLSFYVAITAVLGSVAVWRYELAIGLASSYTAALNVAALGISIALGTSLILTVLIFIYLESITLTFTNHEFIYFVPLAVALIGLFNCFKFLLVRAEQFGKLSKSNIVKSIVTVIVQVLFGFLRFGSFSLILGQLLGVLSQVIYTGGGLSLQKVYGRISLKRMAVMARRYIDFPKFSVWSILANSLANNLSNMVFPAMFSLSTLGFYGMVIRVMGIPSALIGNSIGLVFYKQALLERAASGLAKSVFRYTVIRLIPITILIFGAAFFMIEPIILLFLGQEWQDAAVYGKVLMPFFALRFVGSSLSNLTNAFEKQKIALIWQLAYLTITVTILTCSYYLGVGVITMLTIMSICYSLHYIVLILVLYLIASGKL